VIFLFTWSIPLIIIEFAMGRETKRGTIGAFGNLIGDKYAWMGGFVGLCSTAIMFYYSVVMGWCLKYLVATLAGSMGETNYESYWQLFTSSGVEPVLFHFLAMSLAVLIVARGVVRGIEKANQFLVPSFFAITIFGAVVILSAPGAVDGLRFLFVPRFRDLLDHRVWLEALSQSAWSTGAGWGLILTYAVYVGRRQDFVLTSFLTGLGDSVASLIVACAIIPTVFAVLPLGEAQEVMASGNTGLTFIWIPQLFKRIPGGTFLLPLFFVTLCFAALSSLIAMVELATRLFMDTGFSRKRAVLLVGAAGFLLGLPSALNVRILDNQDWTWGLGLLISGFFFAFAALKYGRRKFRFSLVNGAGTRFPVGRWFEILVAWVIPVEFVVVLSWWLWRSATTFDSAGWWNPFRVTSVATCLAQWGVLIAALLLLNRWLAKRSR
jgi:NSS family neurotransmitter:Na+ symporter